MDADKFAKVLALIDSDHHGEAMSALRAARSMLARDGMTFHDLASTLRHNGAQRHEPPPPPPPPSEPASAQAGTGGNGAGALARVEELEKLVRELEEEIRHAHRIERRHQRALDRQKDETERWRKLARDTAEQLWDMGRALEQQARAHRPTATERWQGIVDHLRDPFHALLSDREIARRVGTSPHLVAIWRRRLGVHGAVKKSDRRLYRFRFLKRRTRAADAHPKRYARPKS